MVVSFLCGYIKMLEGTETNCTRGERMIENHTAII